MPLIAEAQIHTDQASRHLTQFFEHLAQKTRSHPHIKVRVEWSDSSGTAEFRWGRCTMDARSDALALRAEAADQAGLEQIGEFVTRHLETHAAGDQTDIAWERAGTPAGPHDPGYRRDRMRQFHRRARSAGAD